jgi:hypothetical protein
MIWGWWWRSEGRKDGGGYFEHMVGKPHQLAPRTRGAHTPLCTTRLHPDHFRDTAPEGDAAVVSEPQRLESSGGTAVRRHTGDARTAHGRTYGTPLLEWEQGKRLHPPRQQLLTPHVGVSDSVGKLDGGRCRSNGMRSATDRQCTYFPFQECFVT